MTDIQIDRYVKLEGTNHDHRRRLTVTDEAAMKREYRKGKSIASLASKYNVSALTVRYHVVPNYKKTHNEYRKNFKFAEVDQVAQRADRISRKKAILASMV